MPDSKYFYRNGTSNVVTYNDYNLSASTPEFTLDKIKLRYRRYVDYLIQQDSFEVPDLEEPLQYNSYSTKPYTPIPVDELYGLPPDPTNTKEGSIVGKDSLPANYSITATVAIAAMLSLERLAQGNSPFSLTVSFVSPHPPTVVASPYFDYYNNSREQLLVPPSINDTMNNSAYVSANQRLTKPQWGDPEKVPGWTATYYALVEEVDDWFGKILGKLDDLGLTNNTLVVFTSDHGEM